MKSEIHLEITFILIHKYISFIMHKYTGVHRVISKWLKS
jgi:hypothetical protein